jgi:hypothetical protein
MDITGDCYECSAGFPLEQLLDKNVIFELDGVMESHANFMVNYLLYWLFCYRIGKGERGKELRNLVVFDEAKAVFSPFENSAIGFSPIVYMVSMLREFGVGIIAADQTAQLNNAIFANSQLKVLFSLGRKPNGRRLSRFYGDQRKEDERLKEYLLNLTIEEKCVSPICLPGEIPENFKILLKQNRYVKELWEGTGKTDGDTSNSGYDFSLIKKCIKEGVTDINDLAAILALRPKGAVQMSGKGNQYIRLTIANAIKQ